MDEWMTTDDVAKYLKVNPETVRRWLRTGDMKGSLLGDRTGWRVSKVEVERFMSSREIPNETGKAAA